MSDDQEPKADETKSLSSSSSASASSSKSGDKRSDDHRSDDEREFFLTDADELEVQRRDDEYLDRNYSTTFRWRQRERIWNDWADAAILQHDDSSNHDYLNNLELLSGDQLFMKIDDTTELGKERIKNKQIEGIH